jgi:hypothetical protein
MNGKREVQSVIFNREIWSESRARSWLKAHNYISEKIDITPHALRFRQKDPERYKKFSFFTVPIAKGSIKLIIAEVKLKKQIKK